MDMARSIDPRPNGLGIYDLSNLTWTKSYDPGLKAYEPPSLVKNVYANGTGRPESWGDEKLPGIFKVKALPPPTDNTPLTTTTSSLPIPTPTSSTPPTTTPTPVARENKNTILIVAVSLSATFLIALLILLAIYLSRRSIKFRKAEEEAAQVAKEQKSVSNSSHQSFLAEVYADKIWTEMITEANYLEAGSDSIRPVIEMSTNDIGRRGMGSEIIRTETRSRPGTGGSGRQPSVRSDVESSLEWRRTQSLDVSRSRGRQRERAERVPRPPRPPLSIVTTGEWI